jgi:hypothetical protein
MPESPSSPTPGALQMFRRHPFIASVFALCTVAGAIAGPILQIGPDSMSLPAQFAGGALAGFGVAILICAHKLFD